MKDPSSSHAHKVALLEAERERFRELCDAAFEGIAIHDKGVIVDANQALATMFGYEKGELVGMNTLALAAPESRALIVERIASGYREPYQAVGLRKDGSKFLGQLRGGPIHYQGRSLRVVAVADVSEQKKLEAQFRIAEQMLSMGALAAGVAHEINNPLMYVLGNLQIVGRQLAQMQAEHPDPRLPHLVKCIDEALDGTERVRAIVKDLKSFTRPTGQDRAALDVRRVLESSLRIAGNEVRHRATLARDYQDVPLIEASEIRLAQVFVNLMVNAVQAMEEGRAARQELRLVTRQDERGFAVVEIHDSGPGMPPELLDRIFEPFFTTKPGHGTGLGLSICRTIIEGLGGEIHVESKVGRGTMFRVALPPTKNVAHKIESPESVPALPPRNVLVVDDEPRVGATLKRLLEPDYHVCVASSVDEALKVVRGGQALDLVVCDLMMPEGTGMDLHAELTVTAPALARRMLFVTGGAFTPAAEQFLARKDIRSLEKPVSAEQLRRVLASWKD